MWTNSVNSDTDNNFFLISRIPAGHLVSFWHGQLSQHTAVRVHVCLVFVQIKQISRISLLLSCTLHISQCNNGAQLCFSHAHCLLSPVIIRKMLWYWSCSWQLNCFSSSICTTWSLSHFKGLQFDSIAPNYNSGHLSHLHCQGALYCKMKILQYSGGNPNNQMSPYE